MEYTKPFNIPKELVYNAFKAVYAKGGCAGVDEQSLKDYNSNLQNNLYKLWNRLSSGSYFPPPVKRVAIPKKTGGDRLLGIPTVDDRIAQMVIKMMVEPIIEPIFDQNSYGYRPHKSAHDALVATRKRCWWYSWVIEFDITGLFDNIDHSLLMKAVKRHTNQKWILLYIERWLKAPILTPEGDLLARIKGVPQGGVISPLLANLFMHYVFDCWMRKHHPQIEWCRYADDGLVHCKTKRDAYHLLGMLHKRFNECKLELHREKTEVIYCNNSRYPIKHPHKKFDFLGFTFRDRWIMNPTTKKLFLGFNPEISKTAIKSIRSRTRKLNIRNRTDLSLNDIARFFNPILRGWVEYYGVFNKHSLGAVARHVNLTLIAWLMRKHKHLNRCKTKAARLMYRTSQEQPEMFAHWKQGIAGVFA